MYNPAKNAVLQFTSVLLILCCLSCADKTPEKSNSEKNYAIYILAKDTKEYIVETNTLDSGIIYPEKEGADLNVKEMDRDIIVKHGNYYHLNRKKGQFFKYKIEGKSFIEAASVPLKDFSIDNYFWVGKDTLLLSGLNSKDFTKAKYVIVHTGEMKVLKEGALDIPGPSGKFTSLSTGFAELRKDKLFIGYTYHQQLSSYDYTTSDTMYVATFSYPDMKVLQIQKDTRSTYPGGTNTVQPYSFNDEQGNFYFMTCPGIALGNRADLTTGIFRIQAGQDLLDKDYFFNISGSVIHNHAYGLWYLGGNQAIVRSERKDLFKGLSDHYSTAHFEFYILDLTSKVLKKLDLPLDKGTRRECVIVHGDTAYISVNSTKEGNYIWLYNIKTGVLKKGVQLAGDTDFMMRIDDLKK